MGINADRVIFKQPFSYFRSSPFKQSVKTCIMRRSSCEKRQGGGGNI